MTKIYCCQVCGSSSYNKKVVDHCCQPQVKQILKDGNIIYFTGSKYVNYENQSKPEHSSNPSTKENKEEEA